MHNMHACFFSISIHRIAYPIPYFVLKKYPIVRTAPHCNCILYFTLYYYCTLDLDRCLNPMLRICGSSSNIRKQNGVLAAALCLNNTFLSFLSFLRIYIGYGMDGLIFPFLVFLSTLSF
ncbi:unnamed protein product [Orchesella dallaii]|uniref:Uncharacterized protein n=1 Tax=Orchesella dallaii TaxID=48710 RepID=A0ABP1RCT4_9HEXA